MMQQRVHAHDRRRPGQRPGPQSRTLRRTRMPITLWLAVPLLLASLVPTVSAQEQPTETPQAEPSPAQPSPATAAPAPQETPSGIALHLENTDLLQVIGIIAEQLRL